MKSKKIEPKLGQKYGKLTLISSTKRNDKLAFMCLCECGTRKVVRWSSISYGYTVSCGCFSRSNVIKRSTKHGDAHRKAISKEWIAWHSMKLRCTLKSRSDWHRYGGRGITFCRRWNKFENFLADMGRKPSPSHQLDRIDNDGNYEPANCKWSTPKENSNNRSRKAKAE